MIIDEKDCLKEVESFDKTGFNYTLSLISGKYKLTVLYAIYRHGVIRFNSLQRYLNMVSHKTLSVVLKELEKEFDTPYEMFSFLYGQGCLDLLGCHLIPPNKVTLNRSIFCKEGAHETR